MKTEWDYSSLAFAYLKRPDYSPDALDSVFRLSGVNKGDSVCDVGAGVAHLTLPLAKRGLNVVAVEPNDEMRKYGTQRTSQLKNVQWYEGTGESTKQPDHAFDLVTFGSSFNVTNRSLALKEAKRILKPLGWFVCMWNHRDLEDPIQSQIESCIKSNIANYSYGSRREDQQDLLEKSGLFDKVFRFEGKVQHSQSVEEVLEAWRSHATLQRQAGDRFHDIIEEIEKVLDKTNQTEINIPYTTRGWAARLR